MSEELTPAEQRERQRRQEIVEAMQRTRELLRQKRRERLEGPSEDAEGAA